jgi:DNA-binding beta-propeller fold protein YncE
MKRTLRFLIVTAVAAFGVSLAAQSIPEIPFDANVDLLTLPSFGEVAGIATDSKGQIFVYARTGHAYATLGDERTFYHGGSRLFQFDRSGKFVKEIGRGFYSLNFATQVRVDPQDNIWVVDAGSNQVVKFDPSGQLLLVLGRKPEGIPVRPGRGMPARPIDAPPGAGEGRGGAEGGRGAAAETGAGNPSDIFHRPSDVTWDKVGNIYVADGFGEHNRIAKFTKDGNYLKSWGRTGTEPGQFQGIRGLASDAAGNIYVADEGNKRIQVFDGEGTFKSQVTNVGTPQAICISGGATQYLFSSNSNDPESMENGEIYKLQLNGQPVGRFGKAGKLPKEFGMVNAIDCRSDNELWLAEVWNWRAQKVTLRRQAP